MRSMEFKFRKGISIMKYESIVTKYKINVFPFITKSLMKEYVVGWLQTWDCYIVEGENGLIVFDRNTLHWHLWEQANREELKILLSKKAAKRLEEKYDSMEAI